MRHRLLILRSLCMEHHKSRFYHPVPRKLCNSWIVMADQWSCRLHFDLRDTCLVEPESWSHKWMVLIAAIGTSSWLSQALFHQVKWGTDYLARGWGSYPGSNNSSSCFQNHLSCYCLLYIWDSSFYIQESLGLDPTVSVRRGFLFPLTKFWLLIQNHFQ